MTEHATMIAQDIAHHLHSQTNPAAHEAGRGLIVTHGEGARVCDADGRSYIDAMAGLWCATLGFSNARLADAADRQYRKLGFYHTFFHRTGEDTAALAEKLLDLTGMTGGKAYFTTSGSEANETMLKLAWLYHAAHGEPQRRKIIARDRAFHGSTIAAASMCGLPFMHREFGLPLPGFLHVSCPDPYRGKQEGEDGPAFVARLAAELEVMIEREGPDTIAAFIAEPIQAGGGIIVPPEGYFEAIEAVCRRHGILVFADEIVTGFGRTGQWFGKETVGMKPDMMALAKGLSSSYFPIAAVVMAPLIYDAVRSYAGSANAFGHGFTNSGHPVGVAVAREAIAIYEEMDAPARVARLGAHLRRRFEDIARSSEVVGEVRGEGLMLAIELVADPKTKAPFDPTRKVGAMFDEIALKNGLVSRCMGDSLGFAPPFILSEVEVDEIAHRTALSLSELEAML